jgi:hypothetical protein
VDSPDSDWCRDSERSGSPEGPRVLIYKALVKRLKSPWRSGEVEEVEEEEQEEEEGNQDGECACSVRSWPYSGVIMAAHASS